MLGELLTQLRIFCELEVHFEVIPLTRLGTFFKVYSKVPRW